jgi:hypothetical protein
MSSARSAPRLMRRDTYAEVARPSPGWQLAPALLLKIGPRPSATRKTFSKFSSPGRNDALKARGKPSKSVSKSPSGGVSASRSPHPKITAPSVRAHTACTKERRAWQHGSPPPRPWNGSWPRPTSPWVDVTPAGRGVQAKWLRARRDGLPTSRAAGGAGGRGADAASRGTAPPDLSRRFARARAPSLRTERESVGCCGRRCPARYPR